MSLITIPAYPPAPESLEIMLVDPVSMVRSPFTGQQQVFNWGQGWFECSFALPPLAATDAENWFIFLQNLQGQTNTFQFTAAFVAAYAWMLETGSPVAAITWRLKSNVRKMSLTHMRYFGCQIDAVQAL